jgi:hypothetical protein
VALFPAPAAGAVRLQSRELTLDPSTVGFDTPITRPAEQLDGEQLGVELAAQRGAGSTAHAGIVTPPGVNG